MARISAQRVSELAITGLFLALVRTLAEYYRLRYVRGGAVARRRGTLHHGWADGWTRGVGRGGGVLRRAVPIGDWYCRGYDRVDASVQGGSDRRVSIAETSRDTWQTAFRHVRHGF